MVTRILALALLVGAAACSNNFEARSIILDLRVLGMRSDPAEVVVDVDPASLASTDLPPVATTILLADPLGPRPIQYMLTACPVTDDLRCDEPAQPNRVFAQGTTGDVDASPPVGVLQVDIELLQAALAADDFHGLGGIPVQIELIAKPANAGDDQLIYASKELFYAARIPAGRTENQNPTLAELDADGDPFVEAVPLGVAPAQVVTLEPVEPAGVHETYSVPTLDGNVRVFTENLRYSWFATAGEFSDEQTGGPTDIFGNQPLLRTRWTAPTESGAVRLWLVQRDERGGTYWTERTFIVQN
jgi:hypothetical protein